MRARLDVMTVVIAVMIVFYSPYLLANIMNAHRARDKQLVVPSGLTLFTPFAEMFYSTPGA